MSNRKSQEERLKTLFRYFVDVVRINLFITSTTGKSLITPEYNPYGWTLLADTSDIKQKFREAGDVFEYVDYLHLHHFAFPIRSGYVILGPLILNKRLGHEHYRELALKNGQNPEAILDALQEVRVVSHNQLKSILDLIGEAKDFFLDEGQEKRSEETLPETHETIEKLNRRLRTLLETALTIANGQSGSIMLYQAGRGLSVQVSKGINPQFANRKPLKSGEGISGLAFQEKKTLILTEKISDERLSQLLRRKEIKQSIVMPFENEKRTVRGILNINIETIQPLIKHGDETLKNLSKAATTTLKAF